MIKKRTQKHAHTLERDFLVLSFIMLGILLLFCTFTAWQLHKTQEKARSTALYSQLHMVKHRFDGSLDNVTYYMQLMGDRILSLNADDLDDKVNLFRNNFSLDSNLRNFYSWTLLNWVDVNGNIAITSQNGLLKEPYKAPDYYPINISKSKAWQLFIAPTRLNGIEKYPTIPMAMSIEDDAGQYVGNIITDIVVEKIERDLNEAFREEKLHYLIIDTNEDVIIPANIKGKNSSETSGILSALKSLKHDQQLTTPLKLDGIVYTIAAKSDYPFVILIGFNELIAASQFRDELLPQIYLASAITFVFLIILFIFRQQIILPIIMRLGSTLESETEMRMESERLLAHILKRIPGFVYKHQIQDNAVRTLFMSQGCLKLTGYTAEQYYDGKIKHNDVIHPAYVEDVLLKIGQAFKESKAFELSYPIVTANKQIKWVLNQGMPVTDIKSHEKVFEGLLMDITDIKEAEQEMAKIAKNLAVSNDELKKFADLCSHDLKEPLRTIFSYIQLFKDENSHKEFSEKSEEYLQFIETGAIRLKQLVEDILLYSQVGNQPIQKHMLDLEELLAQTIRALSATVDDKAAVIILDTEDNKILGNHHQMLRLFQNIISNALKFSVSPPHIRIQATHKDGSILISFQDNGIGIPLEDQKDIFTLFKRLNPQDEYPGTGIGLAVCHKIVERHQGEIWVESASGTGSIFFIKLPTNEREII